MQKYKTVQIKKDLHREFKLYCVKNGYNMTTVLESLIRDTLPMKPASSKPTDEQKEMLKEVKKVDLDSLKPHFSHKDSIPFD